MIRRTCFCSSVFFLIAIFSLANAQTPPPSKNQPAKSPGTTANKDKAAREEAKRLEEQRRATALALLFSVAVEARSYRNQTLRSRIQARGADVLWDADAEKARTLFRRAWEAAELADAESQRRFDDERRTREETGKPSPRLYPLVRTEVLRMAAKRDRKLGEEFLAKLEEARKQEAANAPTQSNDSSDATDPLELPPALRHRLSLAQELLRTDVARAIAFADPALARVSIAGLVFLCFLREENAVAADERYATMLGIMGADPNSEANAVSLLSSYLFTPFTFVSFTASGGTQISQYNNVPSGPPDVASELRAAFFRVAEQIFLRPLAPPEQDQTSSGRIGKYLVMTSLLQYFEQYASEQSTSLMKAQIAALSREIPDEYRQRGQTTMDSRDGGVNDSEKDSIESILDRIERAANQDERDNLYAQAAVMASGKEDPRAFDFADKIENSDIRKSVRGWVAFMATRHAIEEKPIDKALKLIRSGALTSMQRVWALIQVAQTLHKSDREKAIELLEEAATEARRIGGSSADRSRALVGVATALYEATRGPAWDMMSEVVISANNATEEYSREDASIVVSLKTKTQTSIISPSEVEFDLPGIFRSLAKEDLQRAILLAKDFNGESPRAVALIAIVSAILEKKPGAVLTK